jgi:hypothetical protein
MYLIRAVVDKKNYLPWDGFDSYTYLFLVYFSKDRKYVCHPTPGAFNSGLGYNGLQSTRLHTTLSQ